MFAGRYSPTTVHLVGTGSLDPSRNGTHLELESKFCTCPVLLWILRAVVIRQAVWRCRALSSALFLERDWARGE